MSRKIHQSTPLISVAALMAAILLTGCMASITTHQFSYYGTDALLSGRDFDYVKAGLKGKSYTSYEVYRGGGYVKDGLVADAKRNLRRQYQLGPNEAYANVSIDVLTTRSGPMTQGGLKETKVALTVVISADVVRLGGAVGASGVGGSVGGSLSSLPPVQMPEVEEVDPNAWRSEIGREVYVVAKKIPCKGIITKVEDDYVQVKYSIGGNEYEKFFFEDEVHKTAIEAKRASQN